jgi:hypothetical protein
VNARVSVKDCLASDKYVQVFFHPVAFRSSASISGTYDWGVGKALGILSNSLRFAVRDFAIQTIGRDSAGWRIHERAGTEVIASSWMLLSVVP